MTTTAAKKAAKRARRPIYGEIRRMADIETGEVRLAIVASHPIDRALMKDRKYREGDELRLEIKRPRNPKFHRLMHAVGALLVDNVDEFSSMDSHEALKTVQARAGVCCDPETFVIDLGTLGRHEIQRQVPRSMAFDELDESEFKKLFDGVTRYIDENFQSVMTDEVRAEYLLMVGGGC